MSAGAGGTNVKGMAFAGTNIPADQMERLEALAKRNERSKSAEIRIAIREHLERHERNAA